MLQFLEIYLSATGVGELFYGAQKSTKVVENVQAISSIVENSVVLPCDAGTAFFYGSIKNDLRAKGRPIPENDIWIAAIALQRSLTLVTRDAHFAQVDGLLIDGW